MIRIILLGILIFMLFRLVGRLLFPSSGTRQRNFTRYEDDNRREGDVTIENKDQGKKKVSKKEGDYIDFEEID